MSRGIEVRQAFMKSAIQIVSEQGIQNVTTKALSIDSGLSEVYIYRYFKGKDDLLKQTFDSLDLEFMYIMKKSLSSIIDTKKGNASIGFKALFHDFWEFTLSNRSKCSFFIQYYYSSYYSASAHPESARKAIYQPLLDMITPFFAKEADPWVELNHMYDVAFPKILRVIRGSIPDTSETEENVYRELFSKEENNLI